MNVLGELAFRRAIPAMEHPARKAESPPGRRAFRPVGGQESAVKASGLVPQPPSTSAACDQQAELAQVAVISPLAAENVDAALLHAPQLGARHLGHGTRTVELARAGRYAHVRRVAGIGYVVDAHADADTDTTPLVPPTLAPSPALIPPVPPALAPSPALMPPESPILAPATAFAVAAADRSAELQRPRLGSSSDHWTLMSLLANPHRLAFRITGRTAGSVHVPCKRDTPARRPARPPRAGFDTAACR